MDRTVNNLSSIAIAYYCQPPFLYPISFYLNIQQQFANHLYVTLLLIIQMDNEEEQEFDQDGQRLLKTQPLTLLEKQEAERKKIEHRENMSKPQPNFHGQRAFISKPETIAFKDFTVGKVHFLVITLTNASISFNSFNVLPLPENIRNYFEVEFHPKGKMAPGTTCDIRFKFIPQINEDIHSQFSILAGGGGKISYPIVCTSRKTIVKCPNPLLNFERIIYGQSKKIKLTIRNEGSLPSAYTFLNMNGLELGNNSQEQQKIINNLILERKGQIQGNSQKSIYFEFRPLQIGFFQFKFLLSVKNTLHSPPNEIQLTAQCIEVPVRIEHPVYNIQICLLGHMYRQKLKFYNKSQTPMSFKMVQPPETKKYFEFNPVVGYIQKQSVLDVWIKFTAEKDIVLYLTKFMNQKNHFRIPFQMIVKQQFLPVEFIIQFRFTSDRLNIKPRQLNFGRIFEGVSSKIEVQFQNESQLPQEVYLNIKKNIFIENDQPLLKLLPLQTIKASIIYRSNKLNQLKNYHEEDKIVCKIITGEIATSQLELHYVAEVVRPDLNLTHNKVDFPALQTGEVQEASSIIRNNTNKDILFEIFIPEYQLCGLKVTPVVKTLAPKQQTQINIQYNSFFKNLTPALLKSIANKRKPKQQVEQKKVQQVVDKKDKKEAKKQTKLTKQQLQQLELQQKRLQEEQRARKQKEQQQRLQMQKNFNAEQELIKIGGKVFNFDKTQHYQWLLPIYFKQKDYSDVSAEINYLEVTTTTIQEILVIDLKEVDFGEIAVGSRSVREVMIVNKGGKDVLRKKNMPIFCSFNVLNSMKQIGQNSNFKAVIEFQPIQQQKFQQRLQFYTDKYTVSCCLKGKGVRPQVLIEPENGLVPLGGVVLDQFVQKVIKIKNICNFQINFVLNKMGEGISNTNSGSAFSYIPSYGVLPAHGSVEVKVKFRPDRISEKYYEKMMVHVEQQKSINYFYVSGSCYSRQAYITNYKFPQMPDNELVKVKAQYAFDSLRIKDQNIVYSVGNKTIILQFPKGDDKTYQKKLIVGSCKLLDNKLEKPSNFEIILPRDDRFQCDNLKGAASAGSETIITFTYKTEESDPLFATIPGLSSVGQWKEVKGEIKISGGFAKAGVADLISFELVLRFYSNQL